MQKHKVVNVSNAQYNNGTKAVNDFATGKVAMILNQNNADNSILANGMTSDKYGVVPFPAPSDAKAQTASHVAGINLSIFKNTKNQDAALKFVNFMTSAETQTTLDKPFSALPVLNAPPRTSPTTPMRRKPSPISTPASPSRFPWCRPRPVRKHCLQGDEPDVRQDCLRRYRQH